MIALADKILARTSSKITTVPDSDDIETRLAIVERDVARLREQVALSSSDAAAARVLAAGADSDVSEVRAGLRAHTQSLNALRETQLELRDAQLEQGREITSLRQDLTEQGREMREGFAMMATGMAQITALLTNVGENRGAPFHTATAALGVPVVNLDRAPVQLDQPAGVSPAVYQDRPVPVATVRGPGTGSRARLACPTGEHPVGAHGTAS